MFSVFSDSLLLKRSLDKEEPLESNSCNSITVVIRIHEIGYMNVYIYILIIYKYISLYNIYTYLIYSIYTNVSETS